MEATTETKTKIIVPIVHLNGTGKQELIRQRDDAWRALDKAYKAIVAMSPNGRDYYPQPGLMEQAVAQSERRQRLIHSIMEEIEFEIGEIN